MFIFESFTKLISGALGGFVFGFLLRKANVSRFNVIVRQLLLKDFTVMKVIFTAIIVGAVGIYAMLGFNMIELAIPTATISAVIIGGSIFGIGMSVLGYCPGTGIAALADGSRDMIFGLFGMIFGAALFGLSQPFIAKKIVLIDNLSNKTLSSVTGLSPWIFIVLLSIFAFGFFYFIEKKEQKSRILVK
ncbi:MAG: hypothetical protein K940chlam5_01566 [Candidatus Anoxychlamydiales bacterium]|nr:hypothetical protein [Candidatus Anoxychlamydiales bacterium]